MILSRHYEKFGKFEELLRRKKNFLVDIGVLKQSTGEEYQSLGILKRACVKKACLLAGEHGGQRYQRGKRNATKVSFGLIQKRQKIMTLQMFGNSVLFVVILCEDNTVYLTQLRFPTAPIV